MYADKRTQKCYKNKKEKKRGGDIRTDQIDVTLLQRKILVTKKWFLGLTIKFL